MIEVSTATAIEATGFDNDYVSRKRVVVTMSAEDALALYTILVNSVANYGLTDEWQKSVVKFARELLKAGNKSR